MESRVVNGIPVIEHKELHRYKWTGKIWQCLLCDKTMTALEMFEASNGMVEPETKDSIGE
jgi:hypothetical protein